MIEKGTWLTISIKDYRENVLEILPEPEEIEEETDEQISGMCRLMFRDMAVDCSVMLLSYSISSGALESLIFFNHTL